MLVWFYSSVLKLRVDVIFDKVYIMLHLCDAPESIWKGIRCVCLMVWWLMVGGSLVVFDGCRLVVNC